MKTKLYFLFLIVFISNGISSQVTHENFDDQCIYTKFFDDFDDQNLSNWQAGEIIREIGQLIDSSLTHNVSNSKLGLTMVKIPNYNDSIDFVGAEFWTNETFLYGVFECKASFANEIGSWPAFWSIHNGSCINNEGPEIDFAEYFCRYLTPPPNKLGHYIHHWSCSGGQFDTDYQYDYQFSPTTNTYKCIWTPDKIEFYVDNVWKKTFTNNGQDWFPHQPVSVILSQQICIPNGYPAYVPFTPQTSYFEWVKVQQYFKPATIACPNVICTSGTAIMDVDQDANNITWVISPSNLFSGNTSGTGKTASMTAATGVSGLGKITYTFKMPSVISGEFFTVEKTFWVGKPGTPLTTPSGYPTLELG